jgi:hypothetical protein
MNTIQEAWESFERAVVPIDAPPIQRQEMRKAFYAGAVSMLNIVTGPLTDMSDEAGCALIDSLVEEGRMFFREFK